MQMFMKSTIIKIVLPAMLFATVLGCAKYKFDPVEPSAFATDWHANTTIAELKKLYVSGNGPVLITSDLVIGGVVTSDDRAGNFYKNLFIQDFTGGIEVKLARTGLYNDYKRGQRVLISCNGLYLGDYGDQIQLGSIYSNSGVWEIGALEGDVLINRHVVRDGAVLHEVTPLEMTPAMLTPDNVGKLVVFHNMQISDTVSLVDGSRLTYADAQNKITRNIGLISVVDTVKYAPGTLVLRTSGYCNFASTPVASGSGSITGILTRYRTTYQLLLRDTDDVDFSQPRVKM